MSTNEKARPMTAIMEQATGTAAFSGAANSFSNHNTAVNARQPKIADLLCRGQENAVSLQYLCSVTGLDGRKIRRIVEKERRNGAPILSSAGGVTGYYLPGNVEEVERFVKSMRSRAREITRTANAVKRCAIE